MIIFTLYSVSLNKTHTHLKVCLRTLFFPSYLPVLTSSLNKPYTSHYCIAFHLLRMSEFHLRLGVLRSFILNLIVVLPKTKGLSGVAPAVWLCSCMQPSLLTSVVKNHSFHVLQNIVQISALQY